MRLDQDQLRQFDQQGFVFLPKVFSAAEVRALRREVPAILAQDRQEVVREKDGKTPRTAFAAHTYNDLFGRLARHPRLIEPVEQLLDGPVYIHQFKINAKAAFDGDVWQWHQDYGTWQRDDAHARGARDEHRPVPGRRHRVQRAADVHPEEPQARRPRSRARRDHDLLSAMDAGSRQGAPLVEEGGLVAPKGPAGSVLMFHGNLVHASPSNLSPWDRTIVYISACHVDNHIRAFKRPAWIAHRDFTPIECLPDDCLLQPAAA